MILQKQVDIDPLGLTNSIMATETKSVVDADTEALLERIAHGTPLPPDIYQRIQERGDKLTEQVRQQFGTVEIAVDLIRGIRDEECYAAGRRYS